MSYHIIGTIHRATAFTIRSSEFCEFLEIRDSMTTTGETNQTVSNTIIAQGDRDHVLERQAAQVNGHNLARCEGHEGPLTVEERQGEVDEWYTFYACQECGTEAVLPPHRWTTIECEGQR
jgi:hypothetical protein